MVLVYILFGMLFGAVRHLSWRWFIHTTKPEQQASKRMLWLPCIKHPCRTFAFLLSTGKKSMKYNKTSESLSEIQNTDGFNPRRKMKALQHYLCWTLAILVCQCCFCSWSLRHIFCLSLCCGEPWGRVWVQCSQLRTMVNHVGNLSASSGGPTRVGKTENRRKFSSCLCS